jgi:hypothetical protein
MGEGRRVSAKATGQRSRCLLRHMGGGIRGMDSDPKQGESHGRKAGRSSDTQDDSVTVRLADRVVVAIKPWDNRTPVSEGPVG